MRFWRRHQGIRAMLATLLALQAGCSSWRVQPVAPATLLAEHPPSRVRLTLTDGSKVELHDPRLANDTVVGMKHATNSRPEDRTALKPQAADTVTVALAQVDSVAVRKGDAGKSVGLFLGIVIGLVLVSAAVCAATDCLDYSLGGFGATPAGD